MNLFFIFDTAHCKKEDDDPKDALLFFYPPQASESYRYALCCQLAGIARFLKATFSSPSVIGLEQGTFVFLWSGNYLLVLGDRSEVDTYILKDQLSFLCGMFCFYHGSIINVFKECRNRRSEFLSRMELAWSRYVNLSHCLGNTLQPSLNALHLKLHKKSSGVIPIANQLLHACQLNSLVLAGSVFHGTRVLSTQLTPQMTNYLFLLTNTNASAPVKNVDTKLRDLPPDIELKLIHLSPKVILDIVKLNHTSAGPRIRVKSGSSKSHHKSSFRDVFPSGAEGDIDSGNCSESVQSGNEILFLPQVAKRSVFGGSFRTSKGVFSCCGLHSRSFRNLIVSRNRNTLDFLNDILCTSSRKVEEVGGGEEDSGIHLTADMLFSDIQTVTNVVNVFCPLHSSLIATSFVHGSNNKRTSTAGINDADFLCFLCVRPCSSINISNFSLKRWNSNLDITTQGCCRRFNDNRPSVQKRGGSSKVQILKCRPLTNSRKASKSKFTTYPKRHPSDVVRYSDSAQTKSWMSCDMLPNIEQNDLEKHVLYVQRYGSSTLVLLLTQICEEKAINYLWNCGFTMLREIEYSSEKQVIEYPLEPTFHMLIYNHLHKILKEYPDFPTSLSIDNLSKEIVQKIQEEFLSDPHLRMISLLTQNESIHASHREHQMAFYLQAEPNSRKLDPLCTLNKKALRRLGKYFKVT